jgi:hypothetical protein
VIEAVLMGGPSDGHGLRLTGVEPTHELNVPIPTEGRLADYAAPSPPAPIVRVARYSLTQWRGPGHFAFYQYAYTTGGGR